MEHLTTAEQRILQQIAKGVQTKEMADTLCLSKHTIKNHKDSICKKLGFKSTMELYIYAHDNATMLQGGGGGGGRYLLGIIPIFYWNSENRKSSYCVLK